MKIKITHLTSVHPRYDTRILIKECSSLVKVEGYEVSLVVADGLGNEVKNDVHIFDVGKLEGRLNRIFRTTKNVLAKAIELDSDIYHLHDPELIPIGLKLNKLGKKVIVDIHENIALQIMDKEYIPHILRKFISYIYRKYEKIVLKKFDYLILAEDSYREYYENLNQNIDVILNMPDIESLKSFISNERNINELFYIGGISNNRGLDVTIDAIKIVKDEIPDIYFHCIGPYSDELLKSLDIKELAENIKFYGRMPLLEGLRYSRNAKVGLSILKPIGNYTRSYSTKIFEYMAIGLPVITSNFELYKNIVEKYNCGLCVDPFDPTEIANAIKYILNHPVQAEKMAQNGKKIVLEKYNWAKEEQKLLNIYREILNER